MKEVVEMVVEVRVAGAYNTASTSTRARETGRGEGTGRDGTRGQCGAQSAVPLPAHAIQLVPRAVKLALQSSALLLSLPPYAYARMCIYMS